MHRKSAGKHREERLAKHRENAIFWIIFLCRQISSHTGTELGVFRRIEDLLGGPLAGHHLKGLDLTSLLRALSLGNLRAGPRLKIIQRRRR